MSEHVDNLVWWYLREEKGKVKKWSGKVKTTFHPAEGTFSSGDAKKIASEITKDDPGLKTAMSRLNFFLNRAGKNASAKVRSAVETAKNIVRKKYGGEATEA